jgi:hypothetical protein
MCHLERSNGGTDGDRVEAKETMAKHDRMFRGQIYGDQMRGQTRRYTAGYAHFL